MADLWSDENVDHRIVEALRDLGHDVLMAFESGLANHCIPDERVLEEAMRLGRAVVTMNRRHFKRLHQTHPADAGIIICTDDRDAQSLAQRMHTALNLQPEMNGILLSIRRPTRQ